MLFSALIPLSAEAAAPSLFEALQPLSQNQNGFNKPLNLEILSADIYSIVLIAATGFFLAFSFLQKTPTYLLFSLYLATHLLLFAFLQNISAFQTSLILDVVVNFLFIMPVAIGIILTRIFLGASPATENRNGILFTALGLILAGALFSALAPQNLASTLIYLLPLAGLSLSIFLALSQMLNKISGSFYLLCGWLIILPAFCLLLLQQQNPLLFDDWITVLYWASILPQILFFVMAAKHKVDAENAKEKALIEKETRAAKSHLDVKYSKESEEQARLLRIIEREREMMAELRERERQQKEEMRQAKEIADQANRAKSAFLAMVSHEIRTPMNGIMGLVRLMLGTKMNDQQTEYLQTVRKSGDTMMVLLNDILDFEKIQSGKMTLEHTDFDMIKLAHDVITLMSGQAVEKGLKLELITPHDFPVALKGDPARLRQILLNLMSNALKFTKTGSVTLRLQSSPTENNIYKINCAVEDTGIGIAPEALANLFVPFVQADRSTSRHYGGTGLGLAISRDLVTAMGGQIDVKSTPGKGSIFSFSLKLESGDPEALLADTESLDKVLPPARLLVVDDNETNLQVLRGFLEKDGHKVTTATNAQDAIDLCLAVKFDLIFTDIELGQMDGIALTKTLRAQKNNEIAEIPIIAFSGNVSSEDQERFKQAGMNGFIAKPVIPSALRTVMFDTVQAQKNSYLNSFSSAQSLETSETCGTSEPLNQSLLQDLAKALPKEKLNELVQSCLDKNQELIDNILSNLNDQEYLRLRAHELKGMSANFGLVEMSELGKYIEYSAESGDIQKAQEHAQDLKKAHQRAKIDMTRWLAGISDPQ